MTIFVVPIIGEKGIVVDANVEGINYPVLIEMPQDKGTKAPPKGADKLTPLTTQNSEILQTQNRAAPSCIYIQQYLEKVQIMKKGYTVVT